MLFLTELSPLGFLSANGVQQGVMSRIRNLVLALGSTFDELVHGSFSFDLDQAESFVNSGVASISEFMVRKYFLQDAIDNPACQDWSHLFLSKFLPLQIPILAQYMDMEHTLQQYVERFLHVNTVTYQTWKANFASSAVLHRLKKRGCLRRAYLCYLTMLENDYEYEKTFLSKLVPEFVKALEEESGRKVKRKSDALRASRADSCQQRAHRGCTMGKKFGCARQIYYH
eukprot:3837826-Rhodomonas_salina.1